MKLQLLLLLLKWMGRNIKQRLKHTHTHTQARTYTQTQSTNTTCLWSCFGLRSSCPPLPIILLLSLRLNPRSNEPLGNDAPTLPASPVPILSRISQLAARAWSKPANWCHMAEEGKGERETRTKTEKGGRSGVFLLSWFSGWHKTSERLGPNGPVSPHIDQGPGPV